MRGIAFATIKGGVGKTASSAHVAYALSEIGPTLFVDLDPQGNGSRLLGVDATPQTALAGDLLKPKPPSLRSVAVQQYDNLWVAPAHLRMAREEPQLYQWSYAVMGLQNAIAGYETLFDYVVVDTGPHLSCFTRSALHAADLVMVPIPPQAGAYDGALYLANEVSSIEEARGSPIEICGFISWADARNRVENRTWEKLGAAVPFPILETKIARRNGVNKAGLEYKLIFETAEHSSQAAEDYRALAQEIQIRVSTDGLETIVDNAPSSEAAPTVIMGVGDGG